MAKNDMFASLSGYVYTSEPRFWIREGLSGEGDQPIAMQVGGMVVFMPFHILDSIVTQGGFTRDEWLRHRSGILEPSGEWDNKPAQEKCSNCGGSGATGTAESPDSCQRCRGTGVVS